jgi:hypothetical protein
MNGRKSYLMAMVLLALLVVAVVSFWLALPEPRARHVPAVAQWIRRTVLSPPPEKLVWTEEDRAVQKQLEQMLAEREPPQRMVLADGRTVDGRVLEERPDAVVFAEQLGHSGEVSMAISRESIVRIEDRALRLPEITLRDVRFHRAFPDKQVYLCPPFTVLTEESYFAVERILQQQQALYNQFAAQFKSFICGPRPNGIQLLILSDPDEFELCRLRADDVKKGASGFYSIRQDRLIVLHQRDAQWVKDGRRRIADAVAQHQEQIQTPHGLELLRRWKKDARAQLDAQAGAVTGNILRHEGTHQLCYALGVLRPDAARDWVPEGLATWFETGRPGAAGESRILELREASANGTLLSLRQLTSLAQCSESRHYAQAWALTALMMLPEYRAGFFAYLNQIREHPVPLPPDPAEELCRFLPVSPNELERRWMEFIRAQSGL